MTTNVAHMMTLAEIQAARPDVVDAFPLEHLLSGFPAPEEAAAWDLIRRYAREMAAGAVFPPIAVAAWTSPPRRTDGNHRVCAARMLGLAELPARCFWDVGSARFVQHDPHTPARCACGASPIWITASSPERPRRFTTVYCAACLVSALRRQWRGRVADDQIATAAAKGT